MTAAAAVTAAPTGAPRGIIVKPAVATAPPVAGGASSAPAGVAHTLTVTAIDAFANTATGYRGTVHFTSTDAAATLPANYAFVAADNGVHSFTATLRTVGTQSITAAGASNLSINGTKPGITVT